MQETSLFELRSQAKYFFDLVEAGEVVRVPRNGRPAVSPRQLCEAHAIVEAHIEEIRNAWSHHFGA